MKKRRPSIRRSHITFLVVSLFVTGLVLLSFNRNYLGQIFGSTTPATLSFNQTSISTMPGGEFSIPFTVSTNSTTQNAGISAMKIVMRYDQGSLGLLDVVTPQSIQFPSTNMTTIVKNITQGSDAAGKYLSFSVSVPISGSSSLQKSGAFSLKFKSLGEGTSYITFDASASEVVGVTGSDPLFQVSAANSLIVTSSNGAGNQVYKAINLNGPALSVDGISFQAESASGIIVSGNRTENQGVTLVPNVSGTKAQLIRSSVWGRGTNFPKVTIPNVSNNQYSVYLYVWEDNNGQIYSLNIENNVVLSNYNSGSGGTWRRLGPFDVSVNDTALDISTSGGDANLSAIEIWSKSTTNPVPTLSPTPIATATPTRIPLNTPIPSPVFTATPFPPSVPSGGSGFYRGVNFNGSGTVIGGNLWLGSPSSYVTTSAHRFNLSWQTLTNIPSTELKPMLNTGYWGAPITINQVSNGSYDVYLYLREDDGTTSFNLYLEDVRVGSSISTGAPKTWKKIGPYATTINDGNLRISTGGVGAALFTGVEMYSK